MAPRLGLCSRSRPSARSPRRPEILLVSLRGFLLALVLGCAPAASDPTARGLSIRACSPTPSYAEPDAFLLSVAFQNHGDSPLVVLPAAIRREYTALDAGGARYSPFPGPPTPPWRDAFLLAPGETRVVALPGHRDGDGIWVLEPGRYELAVRVEVEGDQADSASPHLDFAAPVWQGALRAAPIEIGFRIGPAARSVGQELPPQGFARFGFFESRAVYIRSHRSFPE